jgi:hypothetical protein
MVGGWLTRDVQRATGLVCDVLLGVGGCQSLQEGGAARERVVKRDEGHIWRGGEYKRRGYQTRRCDGTPLLFLSIPYTGANITLSLSLSHATASLSP